MIEDNRCSILITKCFSKAEAERYVIKKILSLNLPKKEITGGSRPSITLDPPYSHSQKYNIVN